MTTIDDNDDDSDGDDDHDEYNDAESVGDGCRRMWVSPVEH